MMREERGRGEKRVVLRGEGNGDEGGTEGGCIKREKKRKGEIKGSEREK